MILNFLAIGKVFLYSHERSQLVPRISLQTVPISRLAARIFSYAPQQGGSKEEGSILGGLGQLIGGDR